LIQENASDFKPFGSQKQPFLLIAHLPDIFLEGLLRPPQILL
jgi:hypothetical protein